jgi:hypothetical protein
MEGRSEFKDGGVAKLGLGYKLTVDWSIYKTNVVC